MQIVCLRVSDTIEVVHPHCGIHNKHNYLAPKREDRCSLKKQHKKRYEK
jgi:hypothetical protein